MVNPPPPNLLILSGMLEQGQTFTLLKSTKSNDLCLVVISWRRSALRAQSLSAAMKRNSTDRRSRSLSSVLFLFSHEAILLYPGSYNLATGQNAETNYPIGVGASTETTMLLYTFTHVGC